jgi:hypothetical protein
MVAFRYVNIEIEEVHIPIHRVYFLQTFGPQFLEQFLFRLLLETICLLFILFCFVITTLQTGKIENIACY